MRTIQLAILFLALPLAACGVQEDTLHQRLAPVERQAEELQADQQQLLERLAAQDSEMQRLRAELDSLRPQPKGKKGVPARVTAATPANTATTSVTTTSLAVPPPKIVTPAEAAAEDRRLQAPVAPSTASAPSTATATPATSTTSATSAAPAKPQHAPAPPVAPIPSGTLAVTSPAASAVARPTTAPTGTAPVASPQSEQAAYRLALATYEKGKFDEAEQLFDLFLQAWPSGKLAPNALYWKGECLYSRGRTADAVFVFKDVLTRFPRHPKAPDALLKSVMSFKRLGDADNTRLHLSVLQEDYPQSSALKRARELGLDR